MARDLANGGAPGGKRPGWAVRHHRLARPR